MLNQQASWQMLELKPQLQQLLQGSGVKVGNPENVGRKTEDKNVGVPSKNLKSAAGCASSGVLTPVVFALLVALLMHQGLAA